MQFKDVIGQATVAHTLRTMVDYNRLPHALLLVGPRGCGKLILALALAQYMLCENRTSGDACGHCNQCRKAARWVHPDLHFSFPTIGTNALSDHFLPQWRTALAENPFLGINDWLQRIGAENQQGNINKEECVSIVRKLSLKTFENANRLLIMWLPEYLGNEGNRLLKLIEEPPPNTHFVFVAEDPERMLNTVRSRCQFVKVPAFSDEAIRSGLVQRHPELGERAEALAYLADGNFDTALRLVESVENDQAALLLDWLRRAYRGNGVELVKWGEQFAAQGREAQKHFLRYGLHFLREFARLKVTGQDDLRLAEQERKTAQNLQTILEMDQVEHLVDLFSDCLLGVERNANPKILFLAAGIRMHAIFKRQAPQRMVSAGVYL